MVKNYLNIELLQEEIALKLLHVMRTKAQQAKILLSGGKTPQGILTCFLNLWKKDKTERIPEFYWLDERYVPYESELSNFGNAKRICFDKIEGQTLFPFKTNLPLEECRRDYEKILLKTGKLPVFDIAIIGFGTDGHIASLFKKEDDKSDQLVVNTKSPDGIDRLSLTSKVFNQSEQKILIGSGPEKRKVLTDYLEEKREELPIHLLSKEGLEIHFV